MRLFTAVAFFVLLQAAFAPARADLLVDKAEYAAGVLVVEGSTPYQNQYVVLDKRYRERTGRGGRFVFRIKYLPQNCTIQLVAGSRKRQVQVQNCEPGLAPKRR